MRRAALKRTVDLLGAVIGLTVFAVPMLAIAATIRLRMGSPVFFCQRRPGLKGKPFRLCKFRTMQVPRSGEESDPQFDGLRLTQLGKFLRKTSLDELPEFVNVLKGDLSLVGPRPLLMEYLERYSKEQARRHDIKPGLTGWAQVKGRNALSWEEKFRLDLWYVDHWSLWLDIRILFLTLLQTVCQDGIQARGHSTMPEFKGSRSNHS